MPDRNLLAGLPDVERADLARAPHPTPERPGRRQEQRPDLPQIVIHHRLARGASQRLKQLPDPDPGQLRILPEQPVDLGLERLQDPRPRRSPIARRGLAAQRPPDRVLAQSGLTNQALDRLARDEMLAPQLSPLLHTDHPFPAFLSSLTPPALT